jgi:hypothetical protein
MAPATTRRRGLCCVRLQRDASHSPRVARSAAPKDVVIPRHGVSPSASPMTGSSGVSGTPRLFDAITDVSEYWIVRWSLSSAGAMRRPGGGR